MKHLSAYVADLEAAMERDGVEAVMYAHASAGCLHVRPFLDLRKQPQVEAMERIAIASADLVKKYDGIIAVEHGDGRARGALAEHFYSAPLYAAYRATKALFDPAGLLNPGKITDAPPLTEALRMGPDYHPRDVQTGIAFFDAAGRDVGFAEAVEACNGQAVCRKVGVGVMCPPFMVTGEEKDSTRGRANALREALSGGLDSLTGPEVAEAMDLCVACKACRSECPASVDMAALKTAWQEQKWKTERPSLRTRLFAHLPVVARRTAGPLAHVANRVRASPLVREAPARARHRPRARAADVRDEALSREAGSGTWAGRLQARRPSPLARAPRVALFADTFGRFQEPEIPRAALRVFAAAGVEVVVPEYRCCGRTYLSKGYVSHATGAGAAPRRDVRADR